MAITKFKGNDVHTVGDLPKVGSKAPDFKLVAADLSTKSLGDYAGKKKILSINPSFDTGVCQKTAHTFNEKVAGRGDTVVLLISADLPFAQKRFCEANGINTAIVLSSFRSDFGDAFGVKQVDGPLQGLLARAVVVLDQNNQVKHAELVTEITNEPNYDKALAALA